MFGAIYRLPQLAIKIDELNRRIHKLENTNEDLVLLNGKMFAKMLESETSNELAAHEFKIFSQYGDDGIIQFLIKRLNIDAKSFIEFGVEDYREANTRFLLINNNWKGLIIDGSEANMNRVKSQDLYWRQNLTAVSQFVTRENINQLFSDNGFKGEVGILHIDIDGNDYWVWKEINVIQPQIVIMEYNAVFMLNPWTIPYDPKFYRTDKHHSNLYFGASLAALNELAEQKGYSFVGCNSHGNNAYFVRNDKLKGLEKVDVQKSFVNSEFRESRDENGKLTFVSGDERIKLIKGLPVYNTTTSKLETI